MEGEIIIHYRATELTEKTNKKMNSLCPLCLPRSSGRCYWGLERAQRVGGETLEDNMHRIMTRFTEHELRGVYYRPHIDWADILYNAAGLSKTHTQKNRIEVTGHFTCGLSIINQCRAIHDIFLLDAPVKYATLLLS